MSILLPVRDDQSTLEATVHRLLDLLSDVPCQFELIVIDDGSTDATIEVADELARCYPQVAAVRHARPRGQEAAIQSGLDRAVGNIVLVHDHCGLRRIDRSETATRRPSHLDLPGRTDQPAPHKRVTRGPKLRLAVG